MLELQHSNGLHDLGTIKWDMALCLLIVYVICYFSLWKGISTSGKVSSVSVNIDASHARASAWRVGQPRAAAHRCATGQPTHQALAAARH